MGRVTRFHPDPWRELEELEAWHTQRSNQHSSAQARAGEFTPGHAAALDEIASWYDWLPPGVAMALAQDGRGNRDPLVSRIAQRSGLIRSNTPGGWSTPGQVINAMALSPGQKRLLREDVTQGPTRTAQFAARYRREPGDESITDEDIRRAGDEAVESRRHYLETVGDLDPDEIEEDLAKFRAAAESELRYKRQGGFVERTDTPEFQAQAEANQAPSAGVNPISRASAGVGGEIETATRALGIVANAPLQEGTGLFRSAYSLLPGGAPPTPPSVQSDLGVLLQNHSLSTGSGYSYDPHGDSPLAQERRRRERKYGQIDGHNISLGRAVASYLTPLEEGSQPYNLLSGTVDAGAAIALDPTAWGLGRAARASEARKLIQPDEAIDAVGGFSNGVRKAVSGRSVEQALTGELRPVTEAFAEATSPTRIWRASNRKYDPEFAVRLADDAHSPEQAAEIMREQMGRTIRTVEDFNLTQRAPRRWASLTPGPGFNPNNRQDAMVQLERLMVNSKVPDDTIVSVLDDVARARGRGGLFDAIYGQNGVGGALDEALKAYKVDDPVIRSKLNRFMRNTHEDARHYFVDEIGNDVDVWARMQVGDQTFETGGPHLWSEMLSDWVELPDFRPLRTMTTLQQKIMQGDDSVRKVAHWIFSAHNEAGQARGVSSFFHGAMYWWRRMQLMRPAWFVRVVGDEQARMAASDHDAFFNSPLSFIAWRTAKKGGETDLLDRPWDEVDKFKDLLAKTADWTGDPTRAITDEWTTYTKSIHEHDQFLDSWAGELAQLSRDPIAQHVARAATLDDAVEWFTRGSGREFRSGLMEFQPGLVDDEAARAYIESISQRIQIKTGGSAELVEAVAKGRLDDVPLILDDGGRMQPNRDFVKALVSRLDVAPNKVKGRIVASVPTGRSRGLATAGTAARHATDSAFGVLMTNRTNNLSRIVEGKQSYWDKVEEAIPWASREARDKIMEKARAARLDIGKIGSRRLRRMQRVADTTPITAKPLELEEVDELAYMYALDQTKEKLYDLSERHQIWDAMQLVFPFGEAWHEAWTRWGMLANPLTPRGLKTLRRFDQGLVAGRAPGAGETFGAPKIYNPETGEYEQQGLFWKNEQGEEVFVWPFSGTINKFFTGNPSPLVSRVKGLNMLGTFLPGLGPVAQVPASYFLANKPEWLEGLARQELPLIGETVEESILPFGGPLDEGDWGNIGQLETYLPPWAVRTLTGVTALTTGKPWIVGPEGQRVWNSAVMQEARYLVSTGDYSFDSEKEIQETMEEAEKRAAKLFLVRGLAGSTLPSAPSPDWVMEADGLNGEAVRTYALAQELQWYADPDGGNMTWEEAVNTVLERYGDSVFLATRPLSRSNVGELQANTAFEEWMSDNPDIVRDYPNTFAFFAPRDDDFDIAVYNRQFGQGLREGLDPTEWAKIANNARGQMLLQSARERVGTDRTPEESRWLNDLEEAVARDYPGFGDVDQTKASTETIVRELVRASEDPAIRRVSGGESLVRIMQARRDAMNYAEERGLQPASWARAKSMLDTRNWYRSYGDALVREDPEFAPLWTALEREMVQDIGEPEDAS